MFEHNSDLDYDGLPPRGTRERLAVLDNHRRGESVIVQYRYDNRKLSTTLSYYDIGMARVVGDATTSKYGSIEMFDKLVEYYVKRGFRVKHSGVQVY